MNANAIRFIQSTFLTLLIGSLLSWAILTNAQMDSNDGPYADCAGLIPFDVSDGNDLSDLLIESYAVYYTDPIRYDELSALFLEAVGGGIKNPIKFYNMNESWVLVEHTWNRKLVLWAGANWTVGDDLQVHYGKNEPVCYVVIEDTRQTRQAIRQYPQCDYPYYCK